MIPAINSITPTIAKVVRNPQTAVALATGTLAVLSTHQVWPHPESPKGIPDLEATPDIPEVNVIPDIDPSEITPFGDTVANDNIIDAIGHIADKAKNTFEQVKDFLESLGH